MDTHHSQVPGCTHVNPKHSREYQAYIGSQAGETAVPGRCHLGDKPAEVKAVYIIRRCCVFPHDMGPGHHRFSLSYGLRRNLMPWLQGSSSDGQGLPCRLTPTVGSCPTANVVSSSYPAISTTFNKELQCIKLQQYPWCHCPLQISHGTVTLASRKTHVRGEAELQAIPAELWSQAAAIAECSMWFDLKCVNNALPHNATLVRKAIL